MAGDGGPTPVAVEGRAEPYAAERIVGVSRPPSGHCRWLTVSTRLTLVDGAPAPHQQRVVMRPRPVSTRRHRNAVGQPVPGMRGWGNRGPRDNPLGSSYVIDGQGRARVPRSEEPAPPPVAAPREVLLRGRVLAQMVIKAAVAGLCKQVRACCGFVLLAHCLRVAQSKFALRSTLMFCLSQSKDIHNLCLMLLGHIVYDAGEHALNVVPVIACQTRSVWCIEFP